jgi:hypothetical protein
MDGHCKGKIVTNPLKTNGDSDPYSEKTVAKVYVFEGEWTLREIPF